MEGEAQEDPRKDGKTLIKWSNRLKPIAKKKKKKHLRQHLVS
jgi:hypothetical protein